MQPNPELKAIIEFIRAQFQRAGATRAVIAVSGGIDSALSLTATCLALGADHVFPLLLPYQSQDMTDARVICDWNHVPLANIREVNIDSLANCFIEKLGVHEDETVRRGNIMARCRMIVVYDTAKAKGALVAGTENKSEHYLGYFTRFGDAASDVEPIAHLYKTQVRALAKAMGFPSSITTKAPSAGLWQDQTDEDELGFTYEQADKVLGELIDHRTPAEKIQIEGVTAEVIQKIVARVSSQKFKLEVPYAMGS